MSKLAASLSAESTLPSDARLVSDELRMPGEPESPWDRLKIPFNLLDTCDVVEPAVIGRVFSRVLPKLPDRRVLLMTEEDIDDRDMR